MCDFKNILLSFLLLLAVNAAHARELVLMNCDKIITQQIESYLKPEGTGLQYVAVNMNTVVYEFAGGLADIKNRVPVNRNTTMAAFSMTKTLTAIAVLQLVDAQKIQLDDKASRYIVHPYDQSITIRHLLSHTAGIPNPLPLRWVHLADKHKDFDEFVSLKKVLDSNREQIYAPGETYKYSNIGYWLLGKIIENVTQQEYSDYVRQHLFAPLMIKPDELDFIIIKPENNAHGYLEKYSFMNAVKGFLLDDYTWGEYEGKWLRINDVYLNGPSFGGGIGSASAFGKILQDLLGEHSRLMSDTARVLLFQQAQTDSGENIGMTLGWHIGELAGVRYFFKEGGGAGFHSEMRIYPGKGLGSVVMANQTTFDTKIFLNKLDAEILR